MQPSSLKPVTDVFLTHQLAVAEMSDFFSLFIVLKCVPAVFYSSFYKTDHCKWPRISPSAGWHCWPGKYLSPFASLELTQQTLVLGKSYPDCDHVFKAEAQFQWFHFILFPQNSVCVVFM